MGGGESAVSRETREASERRTQEAVQKGEALERQQGQNFETVLSTLMELMQSPLINDLLVAQQRRDAAASIAGAEESLLDDVLAKYSKTGRGRDARADAMGRRVRLESADQRSRALTDLLVNQQTMNRNASLASANEILKTLQLQQQPAYQIMGALTGAAQNQASISSANAVTNTGPNLSGLGGLVGSLIPGGLGGGEGGLGII